MIIDAVELKRRYLLRIAGARDKKIYIGPEVVDLVINNTCNVTCKFCWNHAPGNPYHFEKGHHYPLEKFITDVRDAVELQVDQIVIVGSGEPSMHPKFREMMGHLEPQPIKTRLYTNATFPPEYCHDVIKADHVTINLSAVDRQQYLELYGKDLFDRVTANIARLARLRDEGKPGFRIELSFVINSVNIGHKDKIHDLAAQLGVNAVFFKKMNVHEYNKDIALPESSMPYIEREDTRTPPQCLSGWFILQRHTDNHSSYCCRIHNMLADDTPRDSLKKVWESQRFMNMRLLGKLGQIQKMHKVCQTCPFYSNNVSRAQAAAREGAYEDQSV